MGRKILTGVSVSPGIAIGNAYLSQNAPPNHQRNITEEEIAHEMIAIDRASQQVRNNLNSTLANLSPNLSECRELLLTQLELARDPKILEGAKGRIKHRKICAAWALTETVTELVNVFQTMADPYLFERAQDIKAIGNSLKKALMALDYYEPEPTLNIQAAKFYPKPGSFNHDSINYLEDLSRGDFCDDDLPQGFFRGDAPLILAAYELSPMEMLELAPDHIIGTLTQDGGVTSHAAILARGLKIPAVTGIPNLMEELQEGELIIVNGFTGKIILSPDAGELDQYKKIDANFIAFKDEAQINATQSSCTKDGIIISVMANIENHAQVKTLSKSGAEGVGLYRTEYSFLASEHDGNDSADYVDENSLINEYAQVINGIYPQKAVLRTLDIGADKLLSLQEALHEPNPALGLRGIRFCLQNQKPFRTQLNAVLRASCDHPVSIMLPMITNAQEIMKVKEILDELHDDLAKKNIPHSWPLPLGVMIETPAAVMISDIIARHCDFLSLGTNDLLHYIMAIDRNNRHVSYLHEPFHPAFLRAIKKTVESAHKYNIPLSVCGEMAADPYGIILLLGLGITSLSASPAFIPSIKHIIRHLDKAACEKMALTALNEENPANTRAMLQNCLKNLFGSEVAMHDCFLVGFS